MSFNTQTLPEQSPGAQQVAQNMTEAANMSYPSRMINQRIAAINDEIVKQRQYLPQFQTRYYQHQSKGRNSHKLLENRSQINAVGIKSDLGMSNITYDNSNFNPAYMDKAYAVAARHHAQSMVSPLAFSSGSNPGQSMPDERQFLGQEHPFFSDQDRDSAYQSQMQAKMRRRMKQQSFEERGLQEHIDQINGGHATSLGILRNIARQNRPAPADMSQLDREYRIRTSGVNNYNSRGALLLHKGSSPVIDNNMRSTQKSSFQTTAGKFNQKRELQPIDKAVFDLNSETADDINPFASEYQNQRQHVLSQGFEPRPLQQQVRIIENDGAFATPTPNRQMMLINNSDIMPAPRMKPKSSMHSKKMSKAHYQLTQLSNTNNGRVVNYINGVPVSDLSPELPQTKRKAKSKLPKINGNKQNQPSSSSVVHNRQQAGQPAFMVRRSQQLASLKKRASATSTKLLSSARKRLYGQSMEPPKEEEPPKPPPAPRDFSRLRNQDEILEDLEEQFGFNVKDNQEAMKKYKEEMEYRKKYATREDKDLIAKNIAYIKTLSESHRNIKQKTKQSSSYLPEKRQLSKEQIMKGLQPKDRLKAKQVLDAHEPDPPKKTSITSPGRSKLSIRKRVSKKDLKDMSIKEGEEDQFNILIPTGKDKEGKQVKVEGKQASEKGILISRNQSVSPRKSKKAIIMDGRVESRQSVMSAENDRGQNRSRGSRASKSPSKSPSKESKDSKGSRRSRRSGTRSRVGGSEYRGYGPMPQRRKQKHRPNNLYGFSSRFFHKKSGNPCIMEIEVEKDDFKHLKADDVDEVSRLEVTYKVLKEQLREHQARLIKKKEEAIEEEEERKLKMMKGKSLKETVDLQAFAKHVRHYENYGSDRTVSPDIKRIVKNLMCQEHSFMYCPKCKTYEQNTLNPIENIQKFMKFVREEQEKLEIQKRRESAKRKKKQRRSGKQKTLPHDSASEITDLEEQEILSKYYDERMTEAERIAKERKIVQNRLYGVKDKKNKKHICSTTHRPSSAPRNNKVRMELREVEKPISMMDESVSAHQFSLQEQSVQADSEQRMDMAQQTSNVDKRSAGHQYSRQDMISMGNQCSDLDHVSNYMNTSMYPPGRDHHGSQTNRKPTPMKVSKNVQTVKARDEYKDDWEVSLVYRRALRIECEKRGRTFVDPVPEHERIDDDSSTQEERQRAMHVRKPSNVRSSNQTETETDVRTTSDKDDGVYTTLGFLKSYKEKGNIKQLTETEIQYVKRLLKQNNHDYWAEPSNLVDLHRHCKYTIRKLTQQMANIDNLSVFKHLKQPTREHTLYLIYRAERLQAALADSQKIFKLLSETIYGADELEIIVKNKSFSMEDVLFLKKRATMFKRILTQSNAFLETYKLFNNQFMFKKMQLRDYLTIMSDRTTKALQQIEELRAANPEKAAEEDAKMKEQQKKKKEEYMNRRVQLEIAERSRDAEEIKIQATNNERTSNTALGQRRTAGKAEKEGMALNINKYREQDLVGRETIDIINAQAERSEIEASHFNKTDRFAMSPPGESRTEDHGGPDLQRVKSGLAAPTKGAYSPLDGELA